MPLAMSFVWEAARFEKKNKEIASILEKFDTVLGLKIDEINELHLIEQRKTARQNKDFAKSDELRDELIKRGYTVKDTKEEMIVKKA